MVSATLANQFRGSLMRMNRSVAASSGGNQITNFFAYLLGTGLLLGGGAYIYYVNSWQNNKIKLIFEKHKQQTDQSDGPEHLISIYGHKD